VNLTHSDNASYFNLDISFSTETRGDQVENSRFFL